MAGTPPSDYVWHSFYAVINALPRVWPYRHLAIEDFLHPKLFEDVRSTDLARGLALRHSTGEEAKAGGSNVLESLWSTLTLRNLTNLLRTRFADEIRKRHGDGPLAVRFGIEAAGFVKDQATHDAVLAKTEGGNAFIGNIIFNR